MTIDEMFNELENKVKDTYIVTLKYKYDFEKDYTIENQILEYDSTIDRYVWLNDWYEGQTDVEVLGYMILGDVDTAKLEPCEDCISRTELLARIDAEREHLLNIKMDGAEHIVVHHARRIIEDMPSVTPSRPKGKWIDSNLPQEKYVCSECGGACWYYDYEGSVAKSKYCPNCGSYNGGDGNGSD